MIWPAAGGSAVLGCGEPGSDRALAVNSSGVAAGATSSPGTEVAVVWRPGGCREELPPLSAGEWAEVDNIDDAGIASGMGGDPSANGSLGIRWTRNATNTGWNPPEVLKDAIYAGADGTNRAGDIVGGICVGGPLGVCGSHAMLWPFPGTVTRTDLGTLGGKVSNAYAINSSDEVAGFSETTRNRNTYGFFWSSTGGMLALAPLQGGSRSEAHGMTGKLADNSRMVVGFSSSRSGPKKAVVWRVP
jgi:hypothetical protein